MNARRREEEQNIGAENSASIPDARRDIAIVDHRIDSRDLFASTREVTISHGGEVYRLRLTAQNKLILTK